jgi:hypothetical protein
MSQMHQVFIDPSAPAAARVICGATRLVIPLGIVAAIVVVGALFFAREPGRISEHV